MAILVTGARGTIGGRVLARLAASGHRVRGSARDTAAPGLPPGTETVPLDLTAPDPAAAERALQGVRTVFLYPARGRIDGFLGAAVAAGVEHLVLLSSPASYLPHEYDGPIGLTHRAIERAVEESGLPHTVLYPSWLATNAARDWAPQLRAAGAVALVHPEAQVSPIHPADIAEVAADLLTSETHRGRLLVLSGPESRSQRELVGVLGTLLGRAIPIERLDEDAALQRRPPWLPEPVLRALLRAEAAAAGLPAPLTNAVERITGRPARGFETWAAENLAAFQVN
ncbi:SDR family oxidoreductase [Kitasatospora sp. NPDC006697]|uniref:SDR family oxidoreductase n=1 Tax=Kitasatospora sp. NPDC006697 TaxID=3364020 RepID=UPI0036A25EB1